MDLIKTYENRYNNFLIQAAAELQEKLIDELQDIPRIDRITVRAKDPNRFVNKAMKKVKNKRKYKDPLSEIQDQIGARIIVFYLDDVQKVESQIDGYYRQIEKKQLIPESENEFGYVGKHYVLFLPDDLKEEENDDLPMFFELQIKTLFQHAWSEANHDLGYKPDQILTSDQKRRLAFTAAQSWGADQIYSQLFQELNL